jgi:hypothetical protein
VKNIRGCEDMGSREVSGIEVELWVVASDENWNDGPNLGLGRRMITGSGGAGCCWKSLPGFCLLIRHFGGLYIADLVSSVGEDGLRVVQYQAGAHQRSEWPNPL